MNQIVVSGYYILISSNFDIFGFEVGKKHTVATRIGCSMVVVVIQGIK